MKAFYLVAGQYDGIVIVEAPNDETMAKVTLASANARNRPDRNSACVHRGGIPQDHCSVALKGS